MKIFYSSNRLVQAVSVLVGGTAAAQIVALAVAPLLTRLYSPEDFGLATFFAGLLSLFSVVACGRYEMAIPVTNNQDDSFHLVALSLALLVLSAIISAVIVGFFGELIAVRLDAPQAKNILWLLPFGVLFAGGYSVFGCWSLKNKKFGLMARTKIQQAVGMVLVQLAGFKFGGASLIVSQIAGQSIGLGALSKSFWVGLDGKDISISRCVSVAARYKRFPIFSTWEALLNTAGFQIPSLAFAVLFSPAIAGLYGLASRVLFVPMSLVGTAVGQIFQAHAAEAHQNGKLNSLVLQLHSKLVDIALAPSLLLALVAPDVFSFIFGTDWRVAGDFSRWLMPWVYLVFVCSPLSSLTLVTGHQSQSLGLQVILMLTRLISIYIGWKFNSINVAIILFSIGSALVWLGYLLWIGVVSGGSALKIIEPNIRALPFALVCVLPTGAGYYFSYVDSYFPLYGGCLSLGILIAGYWCLLKRSI